MSRRDSLDYQDKAERDEEFLKSLLRSGFVSRETAEMAQRKHEHANWGFYDLFENYMDLVKPGLPLERKQEIMALIAQTKGHHGVQALVAEGKVTAQEINTLLACTAPETLGELQDEAYEALS